MTAAPLLPDIQIDEHAPAAEARAFLERDRLLCAYALADLDPANVDDARWWVARRNGQIVALALIVEVLPFRPCFATGRADALTAIFRDVIREPRIIVAVPPPARLSVEATYRFERVERMFRMHVDASRFKPQPRHRVTRLGAAHVDDVIDLYGHASRTYFTPQRLEREIYFGVYESGTLVSAAGTHVRSHASGIAAVGNVLTRLQHRGRGYASAVTSAVSETALAEHRDVVLNVRQENAPAISVYEHLGYTVHAPFVEGPAVRRAAWSRITRHIFGGREGGKKR